MLADVVVGETPDEEEDGEEDEANELQRLSANSIDGSYCEPITRECTSADKNTVTRSQVIQFVVDSITTAVTNGLKNSGGIEAKTVECNLLLLAPKSNGIEEGHLRREGAKTWRYQRESCHS